MSRGLRRCKAKRIALLGCAVVLLTALFVRPAGPGGRFYDAGDHKGPKGPRTHPALAGRSVELASADRGYEELGSEAYQKAIAGAVIDEDTPPRYMNHFYNPSTASGLPEESYAWAFGVWKGGAGQVFPHYQSALEWGRDGMPDSLDWKGAIETYDYTSESKLRAYAAVGHVLHLIQDMAQPDHARNRAHPCNDLGKPMGITDRVGYEELWSQRSQGGLASWPKGVRVQKFSTLEKFFTNLAHESWQQESWQRLPRADELALGCGRMPTVAIRGPAKVGVLGAALGIVYDANLLRILLQHGFDALYDAHWNEAELSGLPAVPTIPVNPSDPLNKAYTTLGEIMLPKAEEYGAGLLQFFHDIVNQPPFVEEVQIYQGQLKYRKTWKDDETGDPPHVQARHAEVEGGGELEAGVNAEITIWIGPKDPDPKLRDTFIRRELKSLKVTVVPDGGKRGDEILVPVHEQGDEKSPRGGIWKGHFTPSGSATLRIEAVDLNEHFKDMGGQREQSLTPVDGKRGTQGDLDSDPSTSARATWRESKADDKAPAGAPYPWKGYEAGPDTNHHFTVRSACGPLGQKALEAMRWGTWTGRVVAHARDNTPLPLEAQLSVSFRAAFESARVGVVKRDSSVSDPNSDLLSALSVPGLIRFGRVRGSGTWTELLHADLPARTCTLSGAVHSLIGYMDFDADPKFRSIPQLYLVLGTERPKSPGLGCNGNSVEIQLMGGEACPNGTWRGKITREDVGQILNQYRAARLSDETIFRNKSENLNIRIGWSEAWKNWSEVSWNLQFAPSAMPPHVRDVVNYLKWQNTVVAGLGAYGHQLQAELMPIQVGLWKAGRQKEAQRFQDAWHSQDNPCTFVFSYTTPESFRDFQNANRTLSELWAGHSYPEGPENLSDAELDQQYAEQLKKLESAIAQFRPVKLSSETKCAMETEKLATVVEAVSPNATSTVQSLRELANKIRKSGIESLADGHP
jgi:hypothetical protein